MTYLKLGRAAVVTAGLLFLAACGGSTPQAEQAAIDEINKAWLEAIVAKDAKKIAALYAEDGEMLPPNATKAVGREAIEQGWAQFLAIPGMTLTFDTNKFQVAKSGDVAIEVQTYKLTTGEGAASVTETGKATVTWVKRDGKWQVFTDMFSSDLPPPQPAPAAPIAPAAATTDGSVAPVSPTAPSADPATVVPPAPAPSAPATPPSN